jgi:hypothetical protein
MITTVPTRPDLPYPFVVPPRTTPYTPLQLHFLNRLAHLVSLCYYGRHTTEGDVPPTLLRAALRVTIDDCFDAGLEPELLGLLADAALTPEA